MGVGLGFGFIDDFLQLVNTNMCQNKCYPRKALKSLYELEKNEKKP